MNRIKKELKNWRELDNDRRVLKLQVEYVCEQLEISLTRYGQYMTNELKAPQKLLADYMTLVKTQDVKHGVDQLIRIRTRLKQLKVPETTFWPRVNKTPTSVRDQIIKNRDVSFDQIVRAWGVLGFEVVIRPVDRTRDHLVDNAELRYFKQIEHERRDKQSKL